MKNSLSIIIPILCHSSEVCVSVKCLSIWRRMECRSRLSFLSTSITGSGAAFRGSWSVERSQGRFSGSWISGAGICTLDTSWIAEKEVQVRRLVSTGIVDHKLIYLDMVLITIGLRFRLSLTVTLWCLEGRQTARARYWSTRTLTQRGTWW